MERLFNCVVGQIEPVLQQVDAQHALQPNGPPPVAGLGVVRLDHSTQGRPRHDGIHRIEEVLALGAPTKSLESRTLVCGHRQCLLLHRQAFTELLCLKTQQSPGQGT